MTNTIISILAAAFLLPVVAAAQSSGTFFDSPTGNNSPVFVPAAFRTINGEQPQSTEMKKFPISMFRKELHELMMQHPEKPRMTEEQEGRLNRTLLLINEAFVYPVSKKRWLGIFRSMSAVAHAEFPSRTSDWDAIVDHMLERAVKSLNDPHTRYLVPDQARSRSQESSWSYAGIGAAASSVREGLRLDLIYPGSEAEKAGIQDGDIVAFVDGIAVGGQSFDEIAARLRGPAGSQVTLGLLRAGKMLDPIGATRKEIRPPNVFSKSAADGIGYVYISEFADGTGAAVVDALLALKQQQASSFIIDIRDNPGGSVKEAASIASEFLHHGDEIVSFRSQDKTSLTEQTDGEGRLAGARVAVLINENSASASEILALALKERDPGAFVVGRQSFGKGTEQATWPVGDGRALKYTENRWYTPSGRNIDARHDPKTGDELAGTGGIVPDYPVSVPAEESEKIMEEIERQLCGRIITHPTPDPVLQKAVEVLTAKRL